MKGRWITFRFSLCFFSIFQTAGICKLNWNSLTVCIIYFLCHLSTTFCALKITKEYHFKKSIIKAKTGGGEREYWNERVGGIGWEYGCVCVCACVRVRACVRASVQACLYYMFVCVCLGMCVCERINDIVFPGPPWAPDCSKMRAKPNTTNSQRAGEQEQSKNQ